MQREWSLLSWERGLKFGEGDGKTASIHVAPLVGAWIEIGNFANTLTEIESLLSWERGLK